MNCRSDNDAKISFSVANSPLLKTALMEKILILKNFNGIGKSDVNINIKKLNIKLKILVS